jgi:16S rRNA (guanine966-N2)-methyltransferase
MRIISGAHKGRRLDAPDWPGLRPTSDRLRETLFNVLAPKIAGARVLDGCAGTGAVGIEALSRGAAHATFADRDPRAIRLISRNLARCGIADRYAIIRTDLSTTAARLPPQTYDLIFLDPPYDTDPVALARAAAERLAAGGLLVIEHARRRTLPDRIDGLTRVRELRAGDSALAFFTSATSGEAATT